MKKILLSILIISSCFSCDVLDVKPQDAVKGDQAFKDKSGIEKGILGTYASLQNLSYYGRSYMIFNDLAADNLNHPADGTQLDYAQVDNNGILPENGSVAGIWASAYESLNTGNNVIVRIPEMTDMTQVEKDKALGELYFLRALNHFNLMVYYGAIPIKTTPTVGTTNVDVPRDPTAAVYQQIIADLTFAEEHLDETGIKVRATKYAATALLARVYLYKGDYALAAAKAAEVIESEGYDLIGYDEIFADDGSPETIFEVDFTILNRNRIAEYNFPKSINGRREVEPNAELLSSYEVGDLRKNASIAYAGALAYAIKYDDLSGGEDNVIVLRLAEMYLIRAEATARLNGNIADIQDDINLIRARADLSGTPASTHAQLLTAIEKERRVEFAFEGHRWFDLVRTGRAVDVLPKVNNVNQTLFPIPLTEIQTNRNPGMSQNPGY